jgi:prepilin-type N-terminal cleavage/methylation domain-containing protein
MTMHNQGVAARRTRRGFTVIELVVTIVVLTVGLLAMAANSAVIGRQMRGARVMAEAANTAQARFELLRAKPCNALSGGTATVGEVTEVWTATNATRTVVVTDTVKYTTRNGEQVHAYRTSIPCPALP